MRSPCSNSVKLKNPYVTSLSMHSPMRRRSAAIKSHTVDNGLTSQRKYTISLYYIIERASEGTRPREHVSAPVILRPTQTKSPRKNYKKFHTKVALIYRRVTTVPSNSVARFVGCSVGAMARRGDGAGSYRTARHLTLVYDAPPPPAIASWVRTVG